MSTDDGKLRWGDYSSAAFAYGTETPTVWVAGEYGTKEIADGRLSWIAEITASGITTGINKDVSKEEKALVYPNPVTLDFFNIKFDLAKDQLIDISIYDLNGQKVETLYYDKALAGLNKFSFNKNALVKGNYILKITHQNEKLIEATKFIVE